MAEALTVTTPPVPAVSKDYTVMRLELDWENSRIAVKLQAGGETVGHAYQGAQAVAMLRALNKADLSAQSLHRRILQRLIADGVVAGAISGVPD